MVRGLKPKQHGMNQVDMHEQTETSANAWFGLRGYKRKVRSPWHSPMARRFLNTWRESRIGSTSKQINDRSHMQFYYFGEYIAYKLTIYRIQRKITLFMATFGSFFVGYLYSGWGANWFSAGYRQGVYQPDDFSRGVMSFFGGDEKLRYELQLSL